MLQGQMESLKLRSNLPLIVEIPSPEGDAGGRTVSRGTRIARHRHQTIAKPRGLQAATPRKDPARFMTTVEGNIETLSRAILGEAQAEIEDVRSRSQSQAEAILQRARDGADQQKAEILEQGTPGCPQTAKTRRRLRHNSRRGLLSSSIGSSFLTRSSTQRRSAFEMLPAARIMPRSLCGCCERPLINCTRALRSSGPTALPRRPSQHRRWNRSPAKQEWSSAWAKHWKPGAACWPSRRMAACSSTTRSRTGLGACKAALRAEVFRVLTGGTP